MIYTEIWSFFHAFCRQRMRLRSPELVGDPWHVCGVALDSQQRQVVLN